MRSFLFSGQGSQKVSMADDLLLSSSSAATIYEKASTFAARDIARFTADDLEKTVNTQLAVSVYGAALWAALPKFEKKEVILAGFSLGEYSALYAAGVVNLAELVQLILWRSQFMQDVIDRYQALGMAAVMGLSASELERVLKQENAASNPAKAVYAVNYNSPKQTVISGVMATIEQLKSPLITAGAKRVIPLKVAGAFHTPFFAEAAKKLAIKARTLDFKKASLPIYSNVSATRLSDDTNWPDYLKTSLVSPVKFTAELAALKEAGITEMWEVGSGNTLTSLIKKTLPGMQIHHASEFLI